MPHRDEGGGQGGVVDVAAGAAQQVAVEDQDPQSAGNLARSAPLLFRLMPAAAVSPARPVRPRDHSRGRAGHDLRRPRDRRGVRGRGQACCPSRPRRATSLRGREPAPVWLLARAARAEGTSTTARTAAAGSPPSSADPPAPRVLLLALAALALAPGLRWRRRAGRSPRRRLRADRPRRCRRPRRPTTPPRGRRRPRPPTTTVDPGHRDAAGGGAARDDPQTPVRHARERRAAATGTARRSASRSTATRIRAPAADPRRSVDLHGDARAAVDAIEKRHAVTEVLVDGLAGAPAQWP